MNKKLTIAVVGAVVAASAIVYTRPTTPVVNPCDSAVRIEASSTREINKDCL